MPDKPLYYAEEPLENEDEDDFGHSEIADVLEHAITRSKGPINIALYGGWGVGKSTIIKFLEKRIEKKDTLEKFQLITVDACKLSPTILRQELLEDMASLLNIDEENKFLATI